MTMDRVKQADPDSADANPKYFYLSAFELIKMYDAGEAKRSDGSALLLQDQVDQLRVDFGDPEKLVYVQATNFGTVNCRGNNYSLWVAIWDRRSKKSPTEEQFNWFERHNKCKVVIVEEKEEGKETSRRSRRRQVTEELGISEKIRNTFNREFEAWLKSIEASEKSKDKDNTKPPKPFTDRIVELVTKSASR